MLAKPSQHVPIYLEYFPSYMMLKWMCKCKKITIFTTFLFPWGDALVIIMLNVILMKKWIGNGWTSSGCAYAYTLRGNRTWRAMSATATDCWLWDENKLWTVLVYSCKRAYSAAVRTTECSTRSIINIPVRMWLAGGRFFIRRIELTATGDVSVCDDCSV